MTINVDIVTFVTYWEHRTLHALCNTEPSNCRWRDLVCGTEESQTVVRCCVGKLPLPAMAVVVVAMALLLHWSRSLDHLTMLNLAIFLAIFATKYLYNQTRDASLRLRRFHSIWARDINRVLDIFAVTTVWFVSSHWVLGLGWRRLDPSKMWGHHHQTRPGEGDFTVTRRINTSQSDTRETFQQWRGAQHYRYRSPGVMAVMGLLTSFIVVCN